jgi:hypothetical protein
MQRARRCRAAALATVLLAAGGIGACQAVAATPGCNLILHPPRDGRFGDEQVNAIALADYLGPRLAGAVPGASPYWRGACRSIFTENAGGYLLWSRAAVFTNARAAENIRRLRASAFVMDAVERSLADRIARGALVSRRGREGGARLELGLWRRGSALLEVLIAAPARSPLPASTLLTFTRLQDRAARRVLASADG